MRYELALDVDSHGRVTRIGWRARDSAGDLQALGSETGPNVTTTDWLGALEMALDRCCENVERNGGVQLYLAF